MRTRISETNVLPDFNLYREYLKIEILISEEPSVGVYYNSRQAYTLEKYIDQLYFLNWNLRGSFISIDEMRAGLGISKSLFTPENIQEDLVLDFLQYAINITLRVKATIKECDNCYMIDKNFCDAIIQNIKYLVNYLHADLILDRQKKEVYIVYNDDLGIIVSQTFPNIKISIAEYKKIDTRGDLQRKGEILCTLFKQLEAEKQKFQGTTYENLYKDTTFLFNKIGARHWVEEDRIASNTFMKMNKDELEHWYDTTYDMFLSCMVISRYLSLKKEIDEIKHIE